MTSTSAEVAFLRDAVEATSDLIVRIEREHWHRPTPCAEMDVGAVVGHLVGGLEQFAGVPAGAGLPATDAPPQEIPLAHDRAAAAYAAASGSMVAEWSQPGAVERTYPMPWGDSPGEMLVGFMVIEQVTHGWDLLHGTGLRGTYGDALIEHTLDIARRYVDESVRVPGMFGPEVAVSPGAPVHDRLAAFLGRHP